MSSKLCKCLAAELNEPLTKTQFTFSRNDRVNLERKKIYSVTLILNYTYKIKNIIIKLKDTDEHHSAYEGYRIKNVSVKNFLFSLRMGVIFTLFFFCLYVAQLTSSYTQFRCKKIASISVKKNNVMKLAQQRSFTTLGKGVKFLNPCVRGVARRTYKGLIIM